MQLVGEVRAIKARQTLVSMASVPDDRSRTSDLELLGMCLAFGAAHCGLPWLLKPYEALEYCYREVDEVLHILVGAIIQMSGPVKSRFVKA